MRKEILQDFFEKYIKGTSEKAMVVDCKLIDNLHKIVKYPDKIYKNKTSKRGEYCLVKKIGDSNYLCSIEIVEEVQIATAFRLRDNDYIKKYTLLWSWEDGAPLS